MRVLSTEATTPKGNKYKITRLGRLTGTGIFGLYGLYTARKFMNSDEFVKNLAKAAKDAAQNNKHYYSGARKTALVVTSAAITALCGFIAGGIADFIANRISKNKADEKKNT